MKEEKKTNQGMVEGLWRVLMFPLGSTSSNVYLSFSMLFFMVFCTEALGLNPAVTGVILTITRMIDGFVDPIIGNIIDRTETRFGKFRPFLLLGTTVMIASMLMMYQVSFTIPQSGRLVWMIVWDTVFVIGYSFVTTVNKSVLSIVTRNPKQRPASGIAGGIYTTLLRAAIGTFVATAIQTQGGFQAPEAWRVGSWIAIALNVTLVLLSLIPIWSRDTPEFYRRAEASAEVQKPKLKDSLEVIKINRPLRMLMVASSMNKLSDGVASAAMMYFYMYAYLNIDMQATVAAATAPIGLIGAFVVGIIATRVGSRNAYIIGTVGNIVVALILLVWRPFSPSLVTVFLILMVMDSLFKRFNAQNVDPMIADVIDYHQYKTGKYLPGAVASSFSFVEQFFSSFSGSIAGIVIGLAGYTSGAEPTPLLYWTVIGLYFGVPMVGDMISMWALNRYEIDNNMYKKMYKEGNLVNETDANKENIELVVETVPVKTS